MPYDNTNRIAIFKNDRKETDRQPDYRATINIDGTEYEAGLWIKESNNDGRKYMAGKVQLRRDRKPTNTEPEREPAHPSLSEENNYDDPPF